MPDFNFERFKEGGFGTFLMQLLEEYKTDMKKLKTVLERQIDYRTVNAVLAQAQYILKDYPEERKYCFAYSDFVKKMALREYAQTLKPEWDEMYWNSLLFEAPEIFESYMMYTERDREPKERFYLPRKKCFDKIGIVPAMQDLEDGIYYILCLSLVPGSGKTTLGEFFMSWVMGRHPDDYNLMSSHSGHVTDMFHTAVKNIIMSKEYKWAETFPKVKIERINEKESTINLNKYKPFASLTCRAIGASQTGVTRCNGYLYCDDLISGLEEALSKPRLDKKNQQYATDLKTRKKQGCKEIHIANRTSVYDVIGNIERQFEGDPMVKIIAIPDLDPETGKSNFNYDYGVGFDEKYFHEIENSLDDVTYRCMFKNEPIEREGLLYHEDDFERYYELPDREPDSILGICDTKDRGTDFCFLPIFYQYGDKYYWEDCAYDNGAIEIVDELCASVIIKHNPHSVQFESNSAGGRTADAINEKIKGKCRTRITKKFTTQNKETKIIVNSGWIKEHVLIKDKSMYTPKSPYGKAVANMFSYTVAGKNLTDDVCDGMAMFAEYVARPKTPSAQVINSPF